MSDERDVVQQYLSYLDSVEFLSKDEERQIGQEIEKNERAIIETCVKFEVFRERLKDLQTQIDRNPDNLIKLTKLLDQESANKEKIKVAEDFEELFRSIDANHADSTVGNKLKKVKLTSSTIHSILNPIKRDYTKIKGLEKDIENTYKFLEVSNREQYDHLVEKCRDSSFRRALAKKLYTDEAKLLSYLQLSNHINNFYEENNFTSKQASEVKELHSTIRQLESNVEEQRERLIKGCMPLVVSRAKKFMNSGLDFEDLIQEGNLGLIKAVDKFDPSKNVRMTTYATWWIDQAIRRGISNKGRTVRVPIHVQDMLHKVNKAYFILSQKLKREPTHTEIAAETGVSEDKIKDLSLRALHEVGIDTEVADGVRYIDILSNYGDGSAFEHAVNHSLHQRIRAVLALLPPKYEKVLRLRFGIGEPDAHTLQDIGDRFSVTKERIRQIENKAISKLQKGGGLKGYE